MTILAIFAFVCLCLGVLFAGIACLKEAFWPVPTRRVEIGSVAVEERGSDIHNHYIASGEIPGVPQSGDDRQALRTRDRHFGITEVYNEAGSADGINNRVMARVDRLRHQFQARIEAVYIERNNLLRLHLSDGMVVLAEPDGRLTTVKPATIPGQEKS